MKIETLAAIVAALTLVGCTDTTKATRALEGAGYSQVETTGYAIFGCGKDDTFHTGFRAKGPNGQPVKGVVCSGILKGATIRVN